MKHLNTAILPAVLVLMLTKAPLASALVPGQVDAFADGTTPFRNPPPPPGSGET